jgi:hypothetical protein
MIILSQSERDKFAAWLEQEAKQSELMVGTMQANKIPQALMMRETSELLASRIIAAKLRSIQGMEIG